MNLRPALILALTLSPLSLLASNWQFVHFDDSIKQIEVVGDLFVAVSKENIVRTSSDGISWQKVADEIQPRYSTFRLDHSGLTYYEFDTVGGELIASISHTVDFENVELLYSTEVSENSRWSLLLWEGTDVQIAILYGGEELLILRSEGGIQWNEIYAGGPRQFRYSYVTEEGDWILASRRDVYSPPGPWLQSSDKGLTWELFNSFFGAYAVLDGRYFGIQTPNIYQYSDNGIDWIAHDIGHSFGATSILFNGERIVISNSSSGPLVSLDGFTYTEAELPPVPNEEFNYAKRGYYDGEYFWIQRFSLTIPDSGIDPIVEYFRSTNGFVWEPADLPEEFPNANQAVTVDQLKMPDAVATPSSLSLPKETVIHLGQLSIQLNYNSQAEEWNLTQQRDGALPEIVDVNWGGRYSRSLSVEPVQLVSMGETIIGLNNRNSIGLLIPSANHLSQPRPDTSNADDGAREIHWEAIEGADFYRIERTANPFSVNPLIQTVAEVNELSWRDESASLIAGRDYFYRVSAHSQDDRFSLPSIWVQSLGNLKGILSGTGMSAIMRPTISWELLGDTLVDRLDYKAHWTHNLESNSGSFIEVDISYSNKWYSWSEYHGWWFKGFHSQERHWQYDFQIGWLWVHPQNLPYVYDPAEKNWMKYESGAHADRIFSVIPKMVE